MTRRRWSVVAVVVVGIAIAAGVSEHSQKVEDERRTDHLYCQLVDDVYEHAPGSGDLCLTVLTENGDR